ncbi:hypothetical protein HDV63DRAFT_373385 [Trichoderma sp. SZMC 28014]
MSQENETAEDQLEMHYIDGSFQEEEYEFGRVLLPFQCRLDFIWLFSEEYAALFRDLKEVGDKISDDLLAFWKLRSCGQRG